MRNTTLINILIITVAFAAAVYVINLGQARDPVRLPSVEPNPVTATPIVKDSEPAKIENTAGKHITKRCSRETVYIAHADGSVTDALKPLCPEREPGAYDHYDDATLYQMSKQDAKAAAELGRRFHEEDPLLARNMMLLSVALAPYDTAPINWIKGVNYSQTRFNNEIAVEQVSEHYVLDRITEEVTSGREEVASRSHALLVEAGFSDADFGALEVRVGEDLSFMREIQSQALGLVTIPGGAM